MAKFTTSLEVMVNNLCDDRTKTIDERIESARTKIFDFQYLTPKTINEEDFKIYFETAFINEYLFDEIAQETVGRFKQRLHSKLLTIMPRYQIIFDILSNANWDEIYNNYGYTEKINGNTTNKSQTGSKGASSNLPENMLATGEIGNFNNVGYASNSSISRSNGESENTENRTVSRVGRTMNQFDTLRQIDGNFNRYFEELIKEFNILFMGLFY